MIALRLILGALEAGFFPGCLYLISTWYARYDLHRRYSGFYLIGCVANGFGGLLAYGLMQMVRIPANTLDRSKLITSQDGLGNYRGWRWIFIMEGIITVIIACVGYFALIDFPDQVGKKKKNFLSERELNWVIQRITKDREDAYTEPFNIKKWARSGLDLKVWGFALIFFCLTATSYSIAYFLPIILRSMGYSIASSQCLVAPPYAMAGILMAATSWVGDRYRTKAPILIFNALVTITGLAVMVSLIPPPH